MVPSMGTFPIVLHTKHDFLKMQIDKKCTDFFGSHLNRMFIEYIQKSIPKVTLEPQLFANKKSIL